jgi:hypothetical protein
MNGPSRRGIGALLRTVRPLHAAFRGDRAQPVDAPRVHAMGPEPDRILVVGADMVSGVGVRSHDRGIGGHMARRLNDLTGRGVDVQLYGIPGMQPRRAAQAIGGFTLERFDGLVVMAGQRYSTITRPQRSWSRDVRRMLSELDRKAPKSLPVIVVGLPPLPEGNSSGNRVVSALERRIAQFNEETAKACADHGRQFVPLRPASDPEKEFNSASYAVWAVTIAATMHSLLLDGPQQGRHEHQHDEVRRRRSLAELGVLDTPPDPVIDNVVRTARDLFGVDAAAVNLVDDVCQWNKSVAGDAPSLNLPRDESFCNTTIMSDGALVVTNALEDPRFSGLPSVAQGLRFYAGYPLEGFDGERVGTLCLLDSRARSFSAADVSLLRELALRIQGLLWARARGN